MSGSGRKRISKWDLKEVPRLSLGDIHNDDWPRKGSKFHNRESQPGWRSPEIAGSNDPWYGAEANNKDGRELSDAIMEWDGDGSYSTKMSPGLDDWRQQSSNRSPKSGWARSYRSRSSSRSRSPPRGFKRESGSNDRSIMAQPCKDFAAGRCRRGDRCPYLHQDDKYFEVGRYSEGGFTDSWEGRHRRGGASKYFTCDDTREHPMRIRRSNDLCNDFFKEKCRRGASCEYAHHSAASDRIGKGYAEEVFRERENDRRNKGASFVHNRDYESRRVGDIPCKFFAAGNCRNGKFCRFSHHGQTRDSSDDRSRDDWRRRSNNLDNVDQLREGLKWSHTTVSDGAKLPECNEDKNGSVGVPEQRAAAWSMDDSWEHTLSNKNRSWVHPIDGHKAVESSEREYLQLKAENTGAGMGVSESKGAESWLGDVKISPAWNYRLSSPNHSVKEETGHVTQTSLTLDETALQAHEQDITREVNQKHHTVAARQLMISESSCLQLNPNLREDDPDALSCEDRKATRDGAMLCIDLNFSASVPTRQSVQQNSQSSSTGTQPLSGLNAVGQNQQTFAPYTPRGELITNTQNQKLFQVDKSFSKPDFGDTNKSEAILEIPSSQSVVSREQLSQLTNLSASLARFFGNGQQLPQLYASTNGANSIELTPSALSNSAGPVASLAAVSIQPNPAIGSPKQYDPMRDSIELIKPEISNPPSGLAPNPVEEKSIADEKSEMPLQILFPSSVPGRPSGGDPCKTGNSEVEINNGSHQLNKLDPIANGKGEEDNGKVTEESKKAQDNGPLDKIDGDGRADESKKNSDGKGVRAFKFALVEFVKELLKPTWKEGQISKEAHKTIVKKVVDKVTGSVQGALIPLSQEKIDNYLSSSKPKLSKLVQAYVEKYQKSTVT